MKKNSWKTFLSVVLLLTMLVSMLPSAAFAEETQSPDAQTAAEETVKVEETKDEVKETPKTETKEAAKETPKTEAKDEVKDENKTEVKDEVKPETKTEVKDETKDEVKEEVKPETKDEVKDETKTETKDEVKDETKTEDKEEVKDEAEEETKDETEEYSDAVKAFLDAVAAISVPEDVSALSEDEIMGLLAQIDAAGACYEELNAEEQALDVVVAKADKLDKIQSALNEQLIELLVLTHGEEQPVTFQVLYVDDSFPIGYNIGAKETTKFICQYTSNHSDTAYTNHTIAIADIKAASERATVDAGYSIVGWAKEASANPAIWPLNHAGTTACNKGSTIYLVAKKPVNNFTVNYYDGNTFLFADKTTSTSSSKDVSITSTVPTKDGYTFVGWTEDAAGNGTLYTAGMTITVVAGTTKTLYAKWEPLPTKATVIYHVNGGTATNGDPVTEEVAPGQYTIKNPAQVGFAAPSGKQFLYWTTAAQEGDGVTAYNPDTRATLSAGDTLELWAQWQTGSTEPPTPDTPNWDGLEVTKVTDPETATVAPGEELTYKITVTNHTGVDLNNVVVVDTLPAGVTFARTSDGSYNNADRTVTVTIPALAKDAVHSFTVTVTVDAETVGSITNTATIVRAVSDMTELGKDISASVTTPVEPKPGPAPDWDATLRITKEIPNMADGKVTLGDEFTYTITVWNSSNYTMENIVVSDTLPSEVDYVSCSGGLTYDSNTRTLTATIDSLDPGRNIFGIAVKVADVSSDTITNTAKITHAECNGNVWNGVKEDTVSIGVVKPIEISKTVDKTTAAPGDTLTYTITVTNNISDAIILNVIDTLPQNITVDEATISNDGYYDSAERTISWSVALSTKEVRELSFKAVIDADFAGDVIAANHVQTTFNDVVYAADSDSVEIKPSTEIKENVPVSVTVEFKGLGNVDRVPAGYKLTGDPANEILSGDIALGAATSRGGHIYKEFSDTAEVVLNKAYALTFVQSGYEVDGYDCDLEVTYTDSKTATDENKSINVYIELRYTKQNLVTCPSVTVRAYFKGVTELPANYELWCMQAPEEAIMFSGSLTTLLTKGVENGVPYVEFKATDVTLQAGVDLNFKFEQRNYNIDGYTCTTSSTEFTRNIALPVTDKIDPIVMEIENVYTKTDAEKTEMPATVKVEFVGLDKDTKLPAGYTLTGDKANEFLTGAIALTKDEAADTAVYTGKIQAVPGKAYDLKFAQTGFNVDGYKCDATAAVSKTVTADAKKGVEVTITLNYTKTDAEKTEMPVAVNVKFVGLDKDTKLPAYTLTGAPTNEFLSGAITLTKDETADTMTYTGKIQAVPGKAYGLSFIQSGFDVAGFICDASAVVTKSVTADAKTGVVVDLVLTYTKINWGGLTITKTADKTYATPGSYVKYTITVTNNTGVDLTNVNVLDYLPSEVRFSSSIGYDSDTSSWTIARLADGKSATVTIRVRLNSGLSTGTKIENTAYVTSVTIDGQTYVFENLWLNDSAVVIVTNGKGAPKTGDGSNLGLWIAVMAASLACAGAAAVIYKKRRTGND